MRIPLPPEPARRSLLLLATAASLAAAPSLARAEGEPASGGTLHVDAAPPQLLLGRDAGADLRVSTPPDVSDLQLAASVGRIEGLRRVPEGGWAARYRPPQERIPQVAIVTAIGHGPRGTEQGFLAIPLSGQGDAKVHGTPGTAVTLRIGDRSFGPRTVGSDGIAVIAVVVPPGTREAHVGFKAIDLAVPERSLLTAALERNIVLADREQQVRFFAWVVAPHGVARRGDVPAVEPSRGSVSLAEREPGFFEGTWTVPPGRAGEEKLTVRLSAAPSSRTVLKLEAAAGPPAVVALAFEPEAYVAGSHEPVRVAARTLDAAGNPVPAAIRLSADDADLSDFSERAPGQVEARLTAGPAFGGRKEVKVTASAPGVGISTTRGLPLRPGEPALARFEGRHRVLRSDGTREVALRVAIQDHYGNPVAQAPRVSAEHGRVVAVASATSDSAGDYVVRYVGPAVQEPVGERLVAEVGRVRTATERLLVPPGGPKALGAAVGVDVDVRGRFAAPGLAFSFERPADVGIAVRYQLDLSWRGEVHLLALPGGAGAALLAGASAERASARTELRGVASAGALLAEHGASPALRLAVQLGARQRPGTPFLEAALLAAGRGAPGAFAAVTLSAGLRFGMERDPWPRS